MLRAMLWRLIALVALALAFLGAVLPVLPTVPFLLLAAAAATRGWPQLDRWLLAHPRHGPTIRAWRARHAVPRRAKVYATLMMVVSDVTVWFTPTPLWLRAAITAGLVMVAGWLWSRPER